ncbi:MAG: hypothetical protein JNK87_41270 [Bryobacterales bacterium]|nr:hypothetical protein [Bryobacterales bacterium]
MGFHYCYDSWLTKDVGPDSDSLLLWLRRVEALGYRPVSPHTGDVQAWIDGDYCPFPTLADAVARLWEIPSSITLWKDPQADVLLHLPSEVTQGQMWHTGFAIDRVHYREDWGNREAVAADCEQLFLLLAEDACWGCVSDEYVDEELLARGVAVGTAWPLLGSLIYAGRGLNDEEQAFLSGIAVRQRQVGEGTLYHLGEYPWQVDRARLAALTEEWLKGRRTGSGLLGRVTGCEAGEV